MKLNVVYVTYRRSITHNTKVIPLIRESFYYGDTKTMETVIRIVNPEINEYAGIDHINHLDKYYILRIQYMSPLYNEISIMFDEVQQIGLDVYRGSSLILENLNRWSL